MFKNSRSLASHNYKFHPSTPSTPRRYVHDFKDDTSGLSEDTDNSIAKITPPDGATIVETLDELKGLIRSLKRKVEFQEDKVEELDNQMLRKNSTKITDIANKLGKIENALKEHNEQSFAEMVHDTLVIRTLLSGKGTKTIGNKIQELKNAALAISEAFDFDWNQAQLLRKITDASFTEAKQIFKENVTAVKEIFSTLPPEDELEKIMRGEESGEADTDENSEPEYGGDGTSALTDLPTNENFLPAENDSDDEDHGSEDSEQAESEDFSESTSEDDE